jgi:hypothetical protein
LIEGSDGVRGHGVLEEYRGVGDVSVVGCVGSLIVATADSVHRRRLSGLHPGDVRTAPHNAAIQQQAQIAQAKANQAAAEAEQESQRNQAEYARQTAIVRAQYKAEVDKAQAEAAQAGPLAEAQAQREVLAMRTELAQRAAELRQQELVSEVVKPAEAEAERVRILALADAEKVKIQAEAAASHNRVALDRMLIVQLPEIVKQAAQGLSGANLTVLNGADGLGEIATAWWDRAWQSSILCAADSVNTRPAMGPNRSNSTRLTTTSPDRQDRLCSSYRRADAVR